MSESEAVSPNARSSIASRLSELSTASHSELQPTIGTLMSDSGAEWPTEPQDDADFSRSALQNSPSAGSAVRSSLRGFPKCEVSRGQPMSRAVVHKVKGTIPLEDGRDEPPFKMKLDPNDRITFQLTKGLKGPIVVNFVLSNPTDSRQAFKVKCTSNEMFRVSPPLGFCDVNESKCITMSFTSHTVPRSGKHFFSIYHMKCTEKGKNAREVWTPQSKPEGVRRLRVFFERPSSTPTNPSGL